MKSILINVYALQGCEWAIQTAAVERGISHILFKLKGEYPSFGGDYQGKCATNYMGTSRGATHFTAV